MTDFLLLHGAYHGGWCWRFVRDRLRAAGHRVLTPSLTGLGDRVHLMNPSISLDTHIKDVVTLAEAEELTDAVLVGHSYGGRVITGAADRTWRRWRALVYVDAHIPKDGQSAFDTQPPERNEAVRRAVLPDGWRVAQQSSESFGVVPEHRGWVDRRMVPQPLLGFTTPLKITGDWARVPRKTYVLALRYRPSAFHGYAAERRRDPDWRVIDLDCGHDIMVDRPEELTRILLEAAG
jgi:pimeloyl-ACP methyl ester carboxylesterase